MRNIIILLVLFCIPALGRAQTRILSTIKTRPGLAAVFMSNSEEVLLATGKSVIKGNSLSGLTSKEFSGHRASITSIDLSNNDEFMLTGSDDKTTRLWNVQTSESKIFNIGEKVIVAQFVGASGNQFVVLDQSGSVTKWSSDQNLPELIRGTDKKVTSMAVDPSGEFLAIANDQGLISIEDLSHKEKTQEWSGHIGTIRNLKFTHDGKFLLSVGDDGKIQKWSSGDWKKAGESNYGKGKIFQLAVSRDDSHISACGGNGCLIINASSMSQITNLNKFSSIPIYSSFSPDGKMLVVMQQLVPKAEIWDISQLDISQFTVLTDATDTTPPQLYISSPPNSSEGLIIVYSDLLAIKGTVIDDAGVAGLRINGIETPMRNNGNFTIMLPLALGENLVNIEATDVNGNTSLKKSIISRRNVNGEVYDAGKAKNYLMVVGINSYEFWPKLNNAVKDAKDVTQTLNSIYKFDFDNITLLTNQSATRNSIYKSLREFVTKVTPQDNFMIYFSGHGYFDELLNEGYWVPVDAKVNSTGDYLSNSDILKIIGNIDSQHTFLVADACFSGSLFSDTKRGYIENVERFKSRWGLASGRLEVVSDGKEGSNSPFAKNFIQFLKENQEDKISVSQLVQEVKMKVAEVSDQTPIGNPLKSVGDEGGEFVFYKRSN